MVKVLNSDALVPKADTIKRDIMESFEEEQEKRKILLQVNHECLNICKNNSKISSKFIYYIYYTNRISQAKFHLL
jgi:hypothetical protein